MESDRFRTPNIRNSWQRSKLSPSNFLLYFECIVKHKVMRIREQIMVLLEKIAFISTVRPTVLSNPSRKRSFPEKFESVVRVERITSSWVRHKAPAVALLWALFLCVLLRYSDRCFFVSRFPLRYSMKIMTAGTDTKLLDQKVYFANGGVYSAVIQPNPEKTSEVSLFFHWNSRSVFLWLR